VVAAGVFHGADYIWLNRAMGFYRNSLGDLLAEQPNLFAAGALYMIYFVGIVVFTVMPAIRGDEWVSSLLLGGLLGLVAFATYDLTNLATLRRWSLLVSLVDIVWGTFVTAMSSLAGFMAIKLLAPIG
jgi:uncharacterized membrane protein